MARTRGLKVVTLKPGCGYGNAGSEYIAGLHALGVPVTWAPLLPNVDDPSIKAVNHRDLHPQIRDDVLPLWQRQIACDTILVDLPPPDAQLYWRHAEPDLRPFTYVTWELEQIPATWLPALNLYECVFVPSAFNRQSLLSAGVTAAVEVVPHIARAVEPVLGGATWGDVAEDDYVFYTIGTWTTRKALERTIRAYLEAFDGNDKVALIVKTDAVNSISHFASEKNQHSPMRPHELTTWWSLANIISEYANPAKIHLIAKFLPALDIDRLHSRGDCFVSLTHSEGWGLTSFDAALFGNPVIITGWGGHLDYLGADYPFLVHHDMVRVSEEKQDGHFQSSGDALWAAADERHAGELMRTVYENQNSAHKIALDLPPQLHTRFNADRVCRHLAGLMSFDIES